jgi:hypothetical protein
MTTAASSSVSNPALVAQASSSAYTGTVFSVQSSAAGNSAYFLIEVLLNISASFFIAMRARTFLECVRNFTC